MEERRWLLPFTYGVSTQAILSVMRLAHSLNATVVPLSLIPLQQTGIRAGRIEQAKDFLESVRWRAEELHVPIECHEVVTNDVQQSIRAITQEWCCTAVVMVLKEHESLLLEFQEMRELLERPPASLVFLRLPTTQKGGILPALLKKVTTWLRKRQDNAANEEGEEESEALSLPSPARGQVSV